MFSCTREMENTETSLSSKRKRIAEINLKYHNPDLGLTAENIRLEKLNDKIIENFDVELWENCLKNLTNSAIKYKTALAHADCENLKEKKWGLLKNAHDDYLKFEKENKTKLTACETLRKARNEAFQEAMTPCNEMFEKIMKINLHN